MKVQSYRDLEVWRRSIDWVQRIYGVSGKFPPDERFGMTTQLRRASISVPCNIAEGAERHGTKEFLQFIGIASGSLAEAQTLLLLARRMAFVTESVATELLDEANAIGRMLSGLRNALERNRH